MAAIPTKDGFITKQCILGKRANPTKQGSVSPPWAPELFHLLGPSWGGAAGSTAPGLAEGGHQLVLGAFKELGLELREAVVPGGRELARKAALGMRREDADETFSASGMPLLSEPESKAHNGALRDLSFLLLQRDFLRSAIRYGGADLWSALQSDPTAVSNPGLFSLTMV